MNSHNMKKINELKQKLSEVDFVKIKFEEDGSGGVTVIFFDEAEKQKLENIAISYFKVKKDTPKSREKNLMKLMNLVLNESLKNFIE